MNLSQFIEWLATNPWLIITSFIITITSLLLAIIFYIKGKKVKLLYYAIRSQNIVRDLISRIDSLDMLYANERIENLTATKIAFWNAGNDTINSNDIASVRPLTINVKEGYKILDAKTLNYNPVNQFSIKLSDDKSQINISFEYLAKNEGAVIQLLHTGKSEQDIEIQGIIKDYSKTPMRINDTHTIDSEYKIILGICFSLPVLVIVIAVADGSFFFIGNIIVAAFLLILFWGLGLLILRDSLPKGLKKFEDKILN